MSIMPEYAPMTPKGRGLDKATPYGCDALFYSQNPAEAGLSA